MINVFCNAHALLNTNMLSNNKELFQFAHKKKLKNYIKNRKFEAGHWIQNSQTWTPWFGN